ncbi:MAG: ACP S-malonyltransferase [Candidatus Brocadiae bacterium]|nr:ACP S-malonyltransferase [Candidatus Brocadiia bacterium]
MKTAALFPGQGAQAVGMGKDLCERSAAARRTFEEAGGILGFDLAKACFEGPEDFLNRTDVCQPAILVHSIAAVRALEEKGAPLVAEAAAGLSLGEYTAHVFAGSLSFADAVRLVRRRGEAMQAACERQPSTMATVLGLDLDALRAAVAAGRGKGVVVIANILGPGQAAISGAVAAVEAAGEAAKAAGAKRVIPLKVAGAFHSPLMAPAVEALRQALAGTEIRAPRIPVISNVTAAEAVEPGQIRELLGRQVGESVLWEESMRRLGAAGVGRFVELGPGKVLTGLARKIVDGAVTVNVEGWANVDAWA